MENNSKVLLMLEEDSFCAQLSQELKKLNASILTADENYMQKVFDEVPHLIIIDENFKNGEGRKIALSIKEDHVVKYIPIILLCKTSPNLKPGSKPTADYYCLKDSGVAKTIASVQEILSQSYNELDINPLTHLPGSRSSILRIERAASSHKLFAFCCIHLEDLEAYNSAYGDARGDEIVIRLSQIIKTVLQKEELHENFFGHLGPDNFVIVTSSEFAVKISELIIQQFDRMAANFYDPEDRQVGYIIQRNHEGALTRYPFVSVSVVIIHNDNLPLTEISQLGHITNELNTVMKNLPGSCYIEYNPKKFSHPADAQKASLDVNFPSKMKSLKIVDPLKKADKYKAFFDTLLQDKKIKTLYQPIVDLKTKKIIGYEALTHSLAKGFTKESTLLFAMARESGRIKELDELCVEYALKDAQALDPDKKLFLNLNHETLIDPLVAKELFRRKGSIGFKNIVIEVTEQSILRSFEKIREALFELKEQGVSVAIDDVGGGAVSLRDVAVLKPNYIKFDRTLVRQIDASQTKQQIVLSMILFANSIQAVTIAEGIETKEEYETVMTCGITLGQGYYFAKSGTAFPVIS